MGFMEATGLDGFVAMMKNEPLKPDDVKSARYNEILRFVKMPAQHDSFLDHVSSDWIRSHTLVVVSHLLGTVKNDPFAEWQLSAEGAVQEKKVKDTKNEAVKTLRKSATLSQSAGKYTTFLTMGGSMLAPQLGNFVAGPEWGGKLATRFLPDLIGNPAMLAKGRTILESTARNASQIGASWIQGFTQSFQAAQYAVQSDSQMEQQKLQEVKGKQQSASGVKNSLQESISRLQQQQDGIAQATKISAN